MSDHTQNYYGGGLEEGPPIHNDEECIAALEAENEALKTKLEEACRMHRERCDERDSLVKEKVSLNHAYNHLVDKLEAIESALYQHRREDSPFTMFPCS